MHLGSNLVQTFTITMKLQKKIHPVAFASRKLDKAEEKLGITILEACAIVFATRQFRHFLQGIHFTVITDHLPLKFLSALKNPHPKLATMIPHLSQFNCSIKWIKGSTLMDADALSRTPVDDTPP